MVTLASFHAQAVVPSAGEEGDHQGDGPRADAADVGQEEGGEEGDEEAGEEGEEGEEAEEEEGQEEEEEGQEEEGQEEEEKEEEGRQVPGRQAAEGRAQEQGDEGKPAFLCVLSSLPQKRGVSVSELSSAGEGESS